MILTDLVVAGDITDSGFEPWKCDSEATVSRIVSLWSGRADPFVLPGELFWLDSTDEGQRIGLEVLATLGDLGQG